jgi:hypothetical protein
MQCHLMTRCVLPCHRRLILELSETVLEFSCVLTFRGPQSVDHGFTDNYALNFYEYSATHPFSSSTDCCVNTSVPGDIMCSRGVSLDGVPTFWGRKGKRIMWQI